MKTSCLAVILLCACGPADPAEAVAGALGSRDFTLTGTLPGEYGTVELAASAEGNWTLARFQPTIVELTGSVRLQSTAPASGGGTDVSSKTNLCMFFLNVDWEKNLWLDSTQDSNCSFPAATPGDCGLLLVPESLSGTPGAGGGFALTGAAAVRLLGCNGPDGLAHIAVSGVRSEM